MKSSEAKEFGDLPTAKENRIVAHPECITAWQESILSKKFRCTVCKKQFLYRQARQYVTRSGYFTCSECGEKVKIVHCHNCGIMVYPTDCVRYHHKWSTGPGPGAHYEVHRACYAMTKRRLGTMCFIATAVYGKDSETVSMLQTFRDLYLSQFLLGRIFIDVYERVSPFFVSMIGRYSSLRSLVQFLIRPIVWIVGNYMSYKDFD